jgi:hypothetical protein
MNGQDQFNRFIEKHPYARRNLGQFRPHLSRRQFFQIAGAGITGSYLVGQARATDVTWQAPVTTLNKARNVIFILLAGAPSHTDTFDLKVVSGVTPVATAKPDTINGIAWPTGTLPKLGAAFQNNDAAVVRSMRAWALVHNLAQTWTQIGRNPAAALGDIAPNIGTVVALEKTPERLPSHVFPTFLALNSDGAAGPGYFDSKYAPFKTNPNTAGMPNTTNVDGEPRLNAKFDLMHSLDDTLRVNSPLGKPAEDMDDFYKSAKGLMYNPTVNNAFRFAAADSTRYGTTGFGNACLVAKQALAAGQGTRFVQITVGGWDMHQNIYGLNGNPAQGTNIFTLGKQLDDGVSALITDLKAAGLFDQTLIVMAGEFGRTVGKLSAANGRDHYPQQFAVFAGAGVKGGRAIGSTIADGSATDDPGWSRQRDIKPEDIEATIYSALGINWTTIRYDDPFGRGCEYVPHAKDDLYGPINELWG